MRLANTPTSFKKRRDSRTDHSLGDAGAAITLVEYGSYFSSTCHTAHEIITGLREEFGNQLRYIYRHFPIPDHDEARKAAILAEYAAEKHDNFWDVHNALMDSESGGKVNLEKIAKDFNLPMPEEDNPEFKAAAARVDKHIDEAQNTGVLLPPSFFINGRLYDGPWDENSLAEALARPPGYRLKKAATDFVQWGPSAGLALLLMVIVAVTVANTEAWGPSFLSFWKTSFGFTFGGAEFNLPLIKWINDGLLSIFFLVVGLEVKREFTVGRLTNPRAAGLPLAGSVGGVVIPALLYLLIVPFGPLSMGWGTTISTDTAFAIAIIAFMGKRVPIELRVFLTVCAIIDDLISILIVALFYTDEIRLGFLAASAVVTGILIVMNRWRFYRLLPYIVFGLVLWFLVHESGIHATLTGVILALCMPTRPPANFKALDLQARRIFKAESEFRPDDAESEAPSRKSIAMLNSIHDRLESPATKALHGAEPWSTYFVLPIFALANAGVIVTTEVFTTDFRLMLAIFTGLVIGKPIGILLFSWLAVKFNIADKPVSYNWRQLTGAGALAGIGFTMSLFIASEAFPVPTDFAAAKIAIFLASIIAAIIGTVVLWKRVLPASDSET